MSAKTIEAVYRNGAFHPVEPVDVAEETRARVQLADQPQVVGVNQQPPGFSTGASLKKHFGRLKPSGEDPVAIQRRMREEWDERERERTSVP